MYLMMEDLKISVEPGLSLLLSRVGRFLIEEGVQAYLVGGFVRDVLLGRGTADIDIAVNADATAVAPRVAAALGGKYVPLDEVNRIGRVALAGSDATAGRGLDFSTLRGNIEQDLAERDFTIDAMAIELERIAYQKPLSLIDPFGGEADLHRKTIRVVSEAAFKSDAARLLRAVRLAAELDFNIESETEALIRRYSHLVANVAGERVREEMLRILAVPGAGRYLGHLDEMGLLTAIIPELAQARGVSQPYVHYWDVFTHLVQTVTTVDFLLRQGSWQYAGEETLAMVPWSEALSQHFDQAVSSGSTRRSILKLAALLHDIAKPQTRVIDEDGRARFLGHPDEGATLVVGILERLRFSARETRLVETMVKHHLRVGHMSQQELPTHRAIYRYFRDTADAGVDILFLSLADHLATRGPNLDMAEWQRHAQVVEYTLAQYYAEKAVAPPRLVDGHDLIGIFGLSPGPRFREILEAVREAQAGGEVGTREEALAYVGRLIASELNNKQT